MHPHLSGFLKVILQFELALAENKVSLHFTGIVGDVCSLHVAGPNYFAAAAARKAKL